ncbi:hypothetical protein G9A89_022308 [Geosiphon pyriformis]|nr:hypothetical protein G9A89_022308 [Geosiphon pyriformis]
MLTTQRIFSQILSSCPKEKVFPRFWRTFSSSSSLLDDSLRDIIKYRFMEAMTWTPRKPEETLKEEIPSLTKETGSDLYVPPSIKIQDNPLSQYDTSISLLLAAGCHLGHSTSLWNPATAPFIYGTRAGISIINLEQTLVYLRRACKVTRDIALRGGIIVFVGTRPGPFGKLTIEAAKRAEAYQVSKRWLPGLITNSLQVLSRDPAYNNRQENQLSTTRGLSSAMPSKPDLIVLLNPLENAIAMAEAQSANIPTIGIVDTDFDPRRVTYPIPANDDAVRSVELVAGVLSVAARDGVNHRRLMENELDLNRRNHFLNRPRLV